MHRDIETTIRERVQLLLDKALTVWQRPANDYHVADHTTTRPSIFLTRAVTRPVSIAALPIV
jgi:hypothetical protein